MNIAILLSEHANFCMLCIYKIHKENEVEIYF